MQWSVLDQSPVSDGRGEDQAIRDSLVLAQECDRLGYERFDEIVINSWTYDPEARRHSYAPLVKTFELHAGCE
jgi:hypothetical protein